MYIAKQCVQSKIKFSETESACEMRPDSFCSYTWVASAKKSKEFSPHTVTGSHFGLSSFLQCN